MDLTTVITELRAIDERYAPAGGMSRLRSFAKREAAGARSTPDRTSLVKRRWASSQPCVRASASSRRSRRVPKPAVPVAVAKLGPRR